MCRLFGMTAGNAQVHATYWLETAPDSMATQSHRNPDGTGIGWFDIAGDPHLTKQAAPAADDPRFRAEATAVDATTIVTHVRAATTGRNSVVNTHPFLIENRIMAHNGGFSDLAAVNEQLGDYRRFVKGDTDSERYAALIAQQTDLNGGDVGEGLAAAARWLSESVPMYSLNTVVATAGHVWALR